MIWGFVERDAESEESGGGDNAHKLLSYCVMMTVCEVARVCARDRRLGGAHILVVT